MCAKIKADVLLGQQTMVLLLTARGQRTHIERGQNAGCDAYLVKPFSPIKLLDTVGPLLARQAPSGQTPPQLPRRNRAALRPRPGFAAA